MGATDGLPRPPRARVSPITPAMAPRGVGSEQGAQDDVEADEGLDVRRPRARPSRMLGLGAADAGTCAQGGGATRGTASARIRPLRAR